MSIKRWQKNTLFPLYRKQSEYLHRVLTTAKNRGENLTKFIYLLEHFEKTAKCHEVAINTYTSLEIATHENPLGYEELYVNHEAAKGVGRDYRVRIIWRYLRDIIEKDPNFEMFEPYSYEQLAKIPEVIYICPFCDHEIGHYQIDRQVVGLHDDGTEDFEYVVGEFIYDTPCHHLIAEHNFSELILLFEDPEIPHCSWLDKNDILQEMERRNMLEVIDDWPDEYVPGGWQRSDSTLWYFYPEPENIKDVFLSIYNSLIFDDIFSDLSLNLDK